MSVANSTAREEELVARSVEVDAERELSNPLRMERVGAWRRMRELDYSRRRGRQGRVVPWRDMLHCGVGDPCVLSCGDHVSCHLLTRCEGTGPWESCLEYFVHALGRREVSKG